MKTLVTGGGGFLGSRIAQMLDERGDDVLVLGRSRYPHHERTGIATIRADIRDRDALRRAFQGVEVVFHTAALAGIWGPRKLFWETNVEGTRNVIDSCLANGVSKLVFTSTPSVVIGPTDLRGVDESVPYPKRYLAEYPRTKAVAERLVLASNGPSLATVALRPHLIWGPGDPHLIPRVVRAAEAGRLFQVGDGRNLVDITYVDNAAFAHLCAAQKLSMPSNCSGRPFFVSQGEPVALWPWLADVLVAAKAPPVSRRVSYRSAFAVGAFLEGVHRAIRPSVEPRMTRFLAVQLAKSHFFDISAARGDLGYEPRVSSEEGFRHLAAWLPGVAQVSK